MPPSFCVLHGTYAVSLVHQGFFTGDFPVISVLIFEFGSLSLSFFFPTPNIFCTSTNYIGGLAIIQIFGFHMHDNCTAQNVV